VGTIVTPHDTGHTTPMTKPFAFSREWEKMLAFFSGNAVKIRLLDLIPRLPTSASDLREALEHPDVQSMRNEFIRQDRIEQRSRRRSLTNGFLLRFSALVAACAAIACVISIIWEHAFTRGQLMLEAFTLVFALGGVYLKSRRDQARNDLGMAFYKSACAELAIFDHITKNGTYSAQLWIGGYYLIKLVSSHYIPYVHINTQREWEWRGLRNFPGELTWRLFRRTVNRIGESVLLMAAMALCLAGLVVSGAASYALPFVHSVSAPNLAATLMAAGSLALIVIPFVDEPPGSAMRRARAAQHLAELEGLRNLFDPRRMGPHSVDEFALGPHNVHEFVTAMIRSEIEYVRPENLAPSAAHGNPDHATDFTLLSFIEVAGRDRSRRISLYHGDLSSMPQQVDFLIVSALL
jgi:hypothetical protein